MDYSVTFSELEGGEITRGLELAYDESRSTERIGKSLAKNKKKYHPIHRMLHMLSNLQLFHLRRNLVQTPFKKDRKRILTVMANYFFEQFPAAPLTNLNRILEEDEYFSELTGQEKRMHQEREDGEERRGLAQEELHCLFPKNASQLPPSRVWPCITPTPPVT